MPRLSPARRQMARAMLRGGIRIADVANEYKITYMAAKKLAPTAPPRLRGRPPRLRAHAKKRSIMPADPRVKTMPPSPFRIPDEARAEIRRLYIEGVRVTDIMARFCIASTTVYTILALSRKRKKIK